jgi:hypothetical protein
VSTGALESSFTERPSRAAIIGGVKGADRARRDADIYLAQRQGQSYALLARRFGLSARQCRRIVEAYRKREPSPFDGAPIEHLERMLEMTDADISDLAEIALTAPNPAAQIGAIRAKRGCVKAQVNLLQRIGFLPTPGRLSHAGVALLERELRQALRRHDAPLELLPDMANVVRRWAREQGLPPLPLRTLSGVEMSTLANPGL